MSGGSGEGMQRDVYGLRIAATGDWPEVVEALDRDFAWFPAATGVADASVHVRRRPPDRSGYPSSLKALRITWRSAEYRDGGRAIVDYGRALAVDDGTGTLTVEGEHGWTAWKAGYDFLLDRIDAHLETIGLARLNGLGLAGSQGGIVLLLPAGGGKTTLTLRALDEGVGLVSEGSPVLDAHGRLHPFPLPLLVRTTSPEAAGLPREHVRDLAGIDPDPASLEVPAFRAAVPPGPVPLRHVVLGVRTLNGVAGLEPLPRRDVVGDLARATLVGFGVLTGGGVRSAPSRLWATRARAVAFARVLRGAQAWRLTLGPDKEANWHALARIV